MSDSTNTWCVPSSILCATIYLIKAQRPVRIAIFSIEPGIDHAQAQVQDESGNWHYLTEIWTGECVAAQLYGKNIPDAPEPYRYVGLVDFINENIDNLGLKEIVNGRS